MSKVRIRLDDEETRSIWNAACRARDEVASWPAWKRGDDGPPQFVNEGCELIRSCNLHTDCELAEQQFRATYPQGKVMSNGYVAWYVDHCHDDCCEDCFGS